MFALQTLSGAAVVGCMKRPLEWSREPQPIRKLKCVKEAHENGFSTIMEEYPHQELVVLHAKRGDRDRLYAHIRAGCTSQTDKQVCRELLSDSDLEALLVDAYKFEKMELARWLMDAGAHVAPLARLPFEHAVL